MLYSSLLRLLLCLYLHLHEVSGYQNIIKNQLDIKSNYNTITKSGTGPAGTRPSQYQALCLQGLFIQSQYLSPLCRPMSTKMAQVLWLYHNSTLTILSACLSTENMISKHFRYGDNSIILHKHFVFNANLHRFPPFCQFTYLACIYFLGEDDHGARRHTCLRDRDARSSRAMTTSIIVQRLQIYDVIARQTPIKNTTLCNYTEKWIYSENLIICLPLTMCNSLPR